MKRLLITAVVLGGAAVTAAVGVATAIRRAYEDYEGES